jgi:hypothetical protein
VPKGDGERSLPDGGRRIPDEIIEASDTVRTGALFVTMCALFVPALCSYQCPLWVKSRHVQRTSRCPLSVPGYFMAGALPLPGIFICNSAGMAALPFCLKVGWSCDDAITSAP